MTRVDSTTTFTGPEGNRFTLVGSAQDISVFAMVARDGTFEAEIMEIMAELLPPDGIALDVGANIGVLTLPLAHICRDGHVFAFEPGTEAAHYLRRNIEMNAISNVTVEETAVMDVTGEVTLEINTDGSAWSYVSDNDDAAVVERVHSVRLDDWLADKPSVTRIDLVKMDVESSELKAMAGAQRVLERFRPVLIVEYNPLIFELVQGTAPTALADALRHYAKYLYALLPTRRSVRVTSQRHLDRICGEHGLINLLASPRPLPPRAGHLRSWPAGLLHHAFIWRRHNRWRRPATAWFASTAVAIDAPAAMRVSSGTIADVPLRIHNRSALWLSSEYEPVPVYCGFRWFDSGGRPYGLPVSPRNLADDHVVDVGSIAPGASADVTCSVRVPDEPGEYELRVGIVQEQFVWIDEANPASGARVHFDVV